MIAVSIPHGIIYLVTIVVMTLAKRHTEACFKRRVNIWHQLDQKRQMQWVRTQPLVDMLCKEFGGKEVTYCICPKQQKPKRLSLIL